MEVEKEAAKTPVCFSPTMSEVTLSLPCDPFDRVNFVSDAILIDPKEKVYHSNMIDALKKGMKHHAFTLEYDADGDVHYKKRIRIRLG